MNVCDAFTPYILIVLGIACIVGNITIAIVAYGSIGAALSQNPAPVAAAILTGLIGIVSAIYLIRTGHEAKD